MDGGRQVQLFEPTHRRDEWAVVRSVRPAAPRRVRPGGTLGSILACALALAGLTAIASAPRWGLAPARAQQAQRALINVAPMTQAEPASRMRLAIQVGPREAVAPHSFIRIRG